MRAASVLGVSTGLILAAGMPPAAVAEVVRVARFGALPDDGVDDTLAVAQAIEACGRSPGARLVFARGRYDFAEGQNPAAPRASMIFRNLSDLTVDGGGALLMFRGLIAPMQFSACAGVRVRNLTIDWERPPFSVGTIVARGDRTLDVRVAEEFPVRGGEPVQALADYDPATRLPRRQGAELYHGVESTELVAPQTLRLHLRTPMNIETGSLTVLRHQVYGFNALVFDRCAGVKVENVTVHTAPGMGLVGQRCDDIALDRFRVVPRPGTGRLMSTTADATHFKACAGTIRMTRCEFDGMGDDAVNVGSLYLQVRQRVDDRTVIAGHPLKMPATPEPGEKLELSHADDLLVYAEADVAAVEPLPADALCRISFAGPLPDELRAGDVLGNASRTAAVRISRCSVRNNRARGMLIQTRDAVVEDCTFENCTSGGVWVLTEVVHFFEAIGTRGVVVRNNTFTRCNYSGPLGEGVLGVYAYLAGFAYPPRPGVHRDTVLENNIIRQADNCGIFVAGADGIVIRGNRIEGVCARPTRDSGRSAICLMSTRNARIAGNTAEPDRQGPGLSAVFTLGPGCEESTVIVEDNQGF